MELTRRRLLRWATGAPLATLLGCGDGPAAPPDLAVSSTPPSTSAATIVMTTSTTTPSSTTTTGPATARRPVVVIGHDAWALPDTGDFVAHVPERITVHHTAVLLDDLTSGPARARRHQEYHRSKGWPDIAYHHLVDRAGNVYQGRPLDARGDTATEYDPTGHYLPCLEGDFDRQEPSTEQLAALVAVVAAVSDHLGLDPATISGHGDHADTTCPGRAVRDRLDEIRQAVREASGRYRIEVLNGEDARRTLAGIEG